MPLIDLDYDLENVSSEFEPLPVGDYLGELETCELVKSSTDKDMLKIKWNVIEGEYEGRKLFDNVVLEVSWKVKQYAEAAGIESGSALDTKDLEHTQALLSVIQQEYQGQMTNKIKKVAPLS